MAFLASLAITAIFATSILQAALAVPVITVHPGDASDLVITAENTVNTTSGPTISSNIWGSYPGGANDLMSTLGNVTNAIAASTTSSRHWGQVRTVENLPIAIVNSFRGGAMNAYVTGKDEQGQLVLLQSDGSFFYPTADPSIATPQEITANVAIPLGPAGSTTNIKLPGYISSGRIWLAEGELQFFVVYSGSNISLVEPSAINPSDPSADINWGFVEFTNTEDGGLYANISYVDFVGFSACDITSKVLAFQGCI